ncbi:hypothetical protein AMJ52_09625 [candidate division TA06 bacterium DG_78]|uniref:Secretion system C-terminal sorting domain-containing protein n=1 Tax=candidate division TA06 bacterium DG_78 TaxID=1703772 RepID=A0A0S7Y8S3_UNCT6|nr:MAG: hypothetical protein AMJ52_09625 [candidate division TA06 bacterium DG_78]
MRKIMALVLTLLVVPMLFGTNKFDAKPIAPENSILAKGISHIVSVEELENEMFYGRDLDTLHFCTFPPYTGIGYTNGGTFEGAIRLTPDELAAYAGWNIIAIYFHLYQTYQMNQYVKVYDGWMDIWPGDMITAESYSGTAFVTAHLTDYVPISGTGDLWCSVQVTHLAGEYPLSVDYGPAVDGKGDWIGPGIWTELQNQPGNPLDYNWLIYAIVSTAFTKDAKTVSIDIPSTITVSDDTTFGPKATVKNLSTGTETFDVTCEIEPGAYTSTKSVSNLASGDEEQVTFDDHTFVGGTHTVTVYTQLSGDEWVDNDTLTKEIEVISGIAEWNPFTSNAFRFRATTISDGEAIIEFTLPVATSVDLYVYDAMGRLRKTLVSDRYSAGTHSLNVHLDLPSGVYFYCLTTEFGTINKKCLIVK